MQHTLTAKLLWKPKQITLKVSPRNITTNLYKHLCNLTKEKDHPFSAVYSISGQLINTKAECMPCWSEHFSQLLNAPTISLAPDTKDIVGLTHSTQDDPGEFTIDKIHSDIKKLKGNKAARIFKIPLALLKHWTSYFLVAVQYYLENIVGHIHLVKKALFYHFEKIKAENETIVTIMALFFYVSQLLLS